MELAEVHWRTAPGDRLLTRFDGAFGRGFLDDLVEGAGFRVLACTRDRSGAVVEVRRELSLPDTVGPSMRVLVCGLNPAVYAAERGVGFARGSNRFWPAAVAAGLVERPREPRHALEAHGIGMTDLVKRATVASAELSVEEYRHGAQRVERLVAWLEPRVVAFVGLEGWRHAFDRNAGPGVQDRLFAGRPAYVLPSTSGLNAHSRLTDLVAHLEAVAHLASSTPNPSADRRPHQSR